MGNADIRFRCSWELTGEGGDRPHGGDETDGYHQQAAPQGSTCYFVVGPCFLSRSYQGSNVADQQRPAEGEYEQWQQIWSEKHDDLPMAGCHWADSRDKPQPRHAVLPSPPPSLDPSETFDLVVARSSTGDATLR